MKRKIIIYIGMLLVIVAIATSCRTQKTCPGMSGHAWDVKHGLGH